MIKRQHALLPLAALLLAVMTLAIYHNVIFRPGVIFGQDTILQGYPLGLFEAQMLRHGVHPSWFPYQMSGFPVTNPTPFYPTDWLMLLLPVGRAITWRFIFHTFVAGLGMYLLLRHWGRTAVAGLLGAAAFAFSGALISKVYAGHASALWSGVWMPLTILLLDRLLETRQMRYAVFAGSMLGLQILGQHPQYVYYTVMAAVIYIVWRAATGNVSRTGGAWRWAGAAVVVILFAALISAPYLLPFAQMSALSNRGSGTGYDFASSMSAHPAQLLTAIAPSFWGSPVKENSVFGALYWDGAMYIGVVPFLFALFAFLKCRDNRARYLKILAVVGLVIGLGSYTPLFKLIYHIPGFSMMRAPSKILFLYTFAVSGLAAWGLDMVLGGRRRDASAQETGRSAHKVFLGVLIGTMTALVVWVSARSLILSLALDAMRATRSGSGAAAKIAGLYHLQIESLVWACVFSLAAVLILRAVFSRRISRQAAAVVIAAISFGDLAMYCTPMLYTVNGNAPYRPTDPAAIRVIQSDHEAFRVLPMDVEAFEYAEGGFDRIESVDGYFPLSLARYSRYVSAIQGGDPYVTVHADVLNHRSPLVGLLNVKYILSSTPLRGDHLQQVYSGRTKVYLNRQFIPRAFTVHEARVTDTEEQSFREIRSPQFDPRKTVVIEGRNAPRPAPSLSADTVQTLRRTPLSMEIDADMSSPGYLVVSEVYYPSWEARVDGKPAKIYPADYLLRGIYLPKGRHTVTMTCTNRLYKAGGALHMAGLVGLIGVILTVRPRRRCK